MVNESEQVTAGPVTPKRRRPSTDTVIDAAMLARMRAIDAAGPQDATVIPDLVRPMLATPLRPVRVLSDPFISDSDKASVTVEEVDAKDTVHLAIAVPEAAVTETVESSLIPSPTRLPDDIDDETERPTATPPFLNPYTHMQLPMEPTPEAASVISSDPSVVSADPLVVSAPAIPAFYMQQQSRAPVAPPIIFSARSPIGQIPAIPQAAAHHVYNIPAPTRPPSGGHDQAAAYNPAFAFRPPWYGAGQFAPPTAAEHARARHQQPQSPRYVAGQFSGYGQYYQPDAQYLIAPPLPLRQERMQATSPRRPTGFARATSGVSALVGNVSRWVAPGEEHYPRYLAHKR